MSEKLTPMALPPALPIRGPAPAGGDLGAAEVQAATDAAEQQGFFGVATDPTPDAAYTVAGVLSATPTPETDAGLAHTASLAAGVGAPPPAPAGGPKETP